MTWMGILQIAQYKLSACIAYDWMPALELLETHVLYTMSIWAQMNAFGPMIRVCRTGHPCFIAWVWAWPLPTALKVRFLRELHKQSLPCLLRMHTQSVHQMLAERSVPADNRQLLQCTSDINQAISLTLLLLSPPKGP